MRGTWRGGAAPHSCHRVRDGAADHQRQRSLRAAQRPARARPGQAAQTPARRRSQQPAEPPFEADAARAVRAGLEARAGHPGPRARRLRRPAACTATSTCVAHQGTSGGFKVLRYVDTPGHECAFYDTALLFPLNALKLDAQRRSASPCSTWPTRAPDADRDAHRAADALAARVAEPQPQARAARRRARQPVDLPGPRLDLRRPRGLPPPGAAVRPRRSRGSATRAASRPTARRSTRPAPRCSRSPRST